MLHSLFGRVLEVGENSVLIDVGGLGFDVLCSRAALSRCAVGESVRLVTHLHFSEAGAVCFGFADKLERDLFLKATMIKGVGGRTGMALLSVLSVADIAQAVATGDVSTFTKVSGIGRKTAERLCFELKNLLPSDFMLGASVGFQASGQGQVVDFVSEALCSLGFSQADVSMVMKLLRAAHGDEFGSMDEERLLKVALKELKK